jgi:hypothetical protein
VITYLFAGFLPGSTPGAGILKRIAEAITQMAKECTD